MSPRKSLVSVLSLSKERRGRNGIGCGHFRVSLERGWWVEGLEVFFGFLIFGLDWFFCKSGRVCCLKNKNTATSPTSVPLLPLTLIPPTGFFASTRTNLRALFRLILLQHSPARLLALPPSRIAITHSAIKLITLFTQAPRPTPKVAHSYYQDRISASTNLSKQVPALSNKLNLRQHRSKLAFNRRICCCTRPVEHRSEI